MPMSSLEVGRGRDFYFHIPFRIASHQSLEQARNTSHRIVLEQFDDGAKSFRF